MKSARRVLLGSVATIAILAFDAPEAAAQPNACSTPKTTCAGYSGYYASTDDVERLKAVADPILRDVRTCLDGNGAKHVPAVLVMRWDSDGKPVEVKIDAPGYESLPCVQKAQTKLAQLQNPHETAIRCEFGCAAPAPPKPAATTPVVVPPPPAPSAAPIPPTQQQPAPAPAPAAAAPSPPPPQYEKVWYGYQTLIADAISLPVMIGGVAGHAQGVTTAGYLGFLLATPVIHMVHGNIGPGFGSLALRFLLPLIGLGVGAVAGLIIGGTQGNGDLDHFGNGATGALDGAVYGTLIAAGGCVLIDAAGFAYTKERIDGQASIGPIPQRTLKSRPITPKLTFTPTFGVHKDFATIGVVGQF